MEEPEKTAWRPIPFPAVFAAELGMIYNKDLICPHILSLTF